MRFENPKTKDVVFGVFWEIDSKYYLTGYWFRKGLYDYYYMYDGDFTYRLTAKEPTDEKGQML